MALERFKVLEIVHKNSLGMSLIKVCRLIEEEVMDFVVTEEDIMNPEYLKTEIGSEMNKYFHQKAQNNKEIMIDLKSRMTFMEITEYVSDEYGNRDVTAYFYLTSSNLFNMERFLIEESESESESEIYEDCPNCEEVYLELGETCEFCGHTRY